MPDIDRNKEVTRRFIDEVFNKHNLDTADELLADDFTDHDPFPGQPNDKKGGIEGFRMMFEAFPDMKATVHDLIAEGDRIAIHSTTSGTHQGEFMGIAATGKRVEMGGIDIVRIVDGKATEHWGIFDAMGVMQQLGVIPPPEG
ncbi:MAG: ester cyclase [Actinomycetota bacterium]